MLLHYNQSVTYLLHNVNNNIERRIKTLKGKELRAAILNSGVKLWQVADALGISDGNFSRKLRKDFNKAEVNEIFAIIEQIKKAPQ